MFWLVDLLYWEWWRGGSHSELVGLTGWNDAGLLRIFFGFGGEGKPVLRQGIMLNAAAA